MGRLSVSFRQNSAKPQMPVVCQDCGDKLTMAAAIGQGRITRGLCIPCQEQERAAAAEIADRNKQSVNLWFAAGSVKHPEPYCDHCWDCGCRMRTVSRLEVRGVLMRSSIWCPECAPLRYARWSPQVVKMPPELERQLPSMHRGRLHRQFTTSFKTYDQDTRKTGDGDDPGPKGIQVSTRETRVPGVWYDRRLDMFGPTWAERMRVYQKVRPHLTERQGHVFKATFVEGLTQKAAAEKLGISLRAVEQHIQHIWRQNFGIRVKDEGVLHAASEYGSSSFFDFD